MGYGDIYGYCWCCCNYFVYFLVCNCMVLVI
nr:MAG TPA: hypothetical protein [Caudoviricetes sp.]